MRRAAVVVPVCGDRALILRRAAQLRFQPGFHSFPGGLIEAADERPAGPADGTAAARCAALRELIEETGICPPADFDQNIDDLRRNLLAGTADERFDELVRQCDWSRWRYLGVWSTPEYAHLRFETHFFSCRLDNCEPPSPNEEVARAWWTGEAEVLKAWQHGTLPASPPVLAALKAALDGQTQFDRAGDARDLLCAGGAIRYLPLRSPTLPPASHTNCCLIGGEGRIFAVDPAPMEASERQLLWRHLQVLAAQGEQLAGVVLSHLHHDHLGAAHWLATKASVPVLASARTASDLDQGLGSGVSAGGYRADDLPLIDQHLRQGDQLPGGWQVLETPGHAHGHLCFWHEASASLVAGDMIASGSTILIEPEQGDLTLYLQSLERLAALAPNLIVPAHGMPIALGGQALSALIAHRRMREGKTEQALSQLGEAGLSDLVRLAYDDTAEVLWPLAELSLHSHLLKLELEGRARSVPGGKWRVDGGAPAA